MEDHSVSPNPSPEDEAPTNKTASVGERYMLPLQPIMDDAAEAKCDASDVEERLGDFGLDTPAESDAMQECRLCKHQRMRRDEAPRKIRRLPAKVTQHALFKKKGAPVKLCPECDGGAVELALKAHLAREAA